MSWSTYTVALPDQVETRLDALQPPGDPFPPRDDQVKAAKEAALSLVKSGAVGTGEAFQIGISGHANEGHKPQTGYANDTVMVTVSQVPASAVDTYDQAQAQQQAGLR